MASPTTDEDLWARARAGEGQAGERLARLGQEIAAFELHRRGAPPGELADLVQESVRSTLAFLVRGGPAPRDLRAFLKFRAWGVLSDARKRMRASRTLLVDPAEAPPAPSREPRPERSAERAQLREALESCRAKLPAELREVLELRYGSRLESEAIAERMQIHRNTVNVRVFRALASLRECLARRGFDAGDLP